MVMALITTASELKMEKQMIGPTWGFSPNDKIHLKADAPTVISEDKALDLNQASV